MKRISALDQLHREGQTIMTSAISQRPRYGSPVRCRKAAEQDGLRGRHFSTSALRAFGWLRAGSLAVLALAGMSACAPMHQAPQEVEARPPKVRYEFSSDEGLIQANEKARTYCSRYHATPSLQGPIAESDDDTKTVTFACVSPTTVTPSPTPPAPPAQGYTYRSDTELLEALRSADAYCARTDETASSSIVTNPDGTKTLTFHCVAS